MTDGTSPVPRYGDFSPASKRASKTLSRTRKKDTKCEIVLRRALWHRGYRYRKHFDRAPGSPDIAFPSAKLAVFCDGDFWHGRDWAERKRKLQEGSNPGYWIPKIRRNIERDEEVNHALHDRGWDVVRLWETDILEDPEAAADEVIAALEVARTD